MWDISCSSLIDAYIAGITTSQAADAGPGIGDTKDAAAPVPTTENTMPNSFGQTEFEASLLSIDRDLNVTKAPLEEERSESEAMNGYLRALLEGEVSTDFGLTDHALDTFEAEQVAGSRFLQELAEIKSGF